MSVCDPVMAYVDVSEWKPDQVCEWLKGLDSTVLPYIHSFLNHGVNGQQLLNLYSLELENLGVVKLGHQEIILEAVEYLRKFHHELEKENLQLLALRLSTQAHCLHKELCRQNALEPLSTQTLSDIASIMTLVKLVVRWMDYPPFSEHIEYHGKKIELIKICIEMATCAQRDRFAERPVQEIRKTSSKLVSLANYIMQDITDPIVLQPATLDLATLKKKSSDDLGFYILPSFHGIHQITEIKLGSAAHQSGKMQEGDEIVQVNYQTVIGWERKNLLQLFRESPAEILLTIKRRPKHTKIYGQVYVIKPYKLPSNENTSYTAQGRSLPSPRPELLTIPDFTMPSLRYMPKKISPESASMLDADKMLDAMTTDSSDSDSETDSQLYPKPRNLVQRRATITGASPTAKHGINIERFWKELKREHDATVQSRDKASSCAHGLDNVPMVNIRPQTCLGLESAKKKDKINEQTNKKVQFEEKVIDAKSTRLDDTKEKVTPTQNCNDDGANIVNKDICIEHLQASTDNVIDSNNLNDIAVPLDESNHSISDTCSINETMSNDKESMQYVERRGKLDKNYNTSTYNLSDTEKLDLSDHCLLKTPNNNLTKTDICKIVENVEDDKKLKDSSNEYKEESARCDGNVAQKISNIEKQIARENAEEEEEEGEACAFRMPKRIDPHKDNIYITINNVLENSTEEKNQKSLKHDISDTSDEKNAVKRLSSECENVINKYSKTIKLKNSACEYHENVNCGASVMSNSEKECNNSNSSSSSSSNSSSSGSNSSRSRSCSSSSSSSSSSNSSNNSDSNDKTGSSSNNSNNNSSSNNSNNNSSNSGGDDGGDGGDGVAGDDDGGDGGGGDNNNDNDINNDNDDCCSNNSSSSSSNSSSSSSSSIRHSFDKILQTVDCTPTQHAELLEKKFSSVLSSENCAEKKSPNNNNTQFIEDNLANITHNILKMQIDIKQQAKEVKSVDSTSAQSAIQSYRYIELPKTESVGRLENKSHATPPEPPPRKYCTNQAIIDLKLNNVQQALEDLQKPQVPERLGIKREFKKVDLSSCVNHIKSNSDSNQDKKDSSDIRVLNYTENSMDLVGESRTISLSDQKFDRLNLSDASLYNENNDKQSREEKCPFTKYETFVEKFVCSDQSITDCYRFDHSPRNVDCPDDMTHSKETISSDLKPRLSEKDKGVEKSVVNRAMMVAKSIGLHSSLNKSNSSPRTNRKRNVLLAKRRNVSVRDIGAGDLEGWLTYRSRGAGGAWAKAWFVLKCSSLYRFKVQDSIKADCLIVLTGFTVSPASEIKSRKYSFKVYHTGTVFYFAADTEDCLILWLDAVSRGTLGADTQNQSVGLYSETDESDSEGHKSKPKCTSESCKLSPEKSFGSLKKSVRKDTTSLKDHEITGASLDRKYLKFLSARNQSMPVPTAQFRSYRRVLPTSTPNKKEVCNSNSPDLQRTIAGSTFYGSTTSQGATDTFNSSDVCDYQHVTDRSVRRPDNPQDFIAQKALAISQQDEEQQQSMMNESISPRECATPLLSDHVHVQHRSLNNNAAYFEQIRQSSDTCLNDIGNNIYDKTNDEIPNNNIMYAQAKNANAHVHPPRQSVRDNFIVARSECEANSANDKSCGKCVAIGQKRMWDSSSYTQKRRAQELVNCQKVRCDETSFHWRNDARDLTKQNSPNQNADYDLNKRVQSPNHENYRMHDYPSSRMIKEYSGSSNDLTWSETQQCIKKDVSISRKGSFNLTNRHNCDYDSSEKHWLDSLRRDDKKGSSCDKNRLKNVAQYQPPPIPTSPFEQEGMRAAFEMHLDKSDYVQKASRLKVLFGTKQQKPCTLDLSKSMQKTVLGGSPQLHRALFRDKCWSNQSQHQPSSGNQSPSGISHSHSCFNTNNNSPSQTFPQPTRGPISSINDWSPDTTSSNISKYHSGYSSSHKSFSNSGRNMAPPMLPYIPPPTSPPPDYPGLEYPPVFEPGTYSLSDASLLRNRNKNYQNTGQ